MDYQPRNPHTPKLEGEIIPPKDYCELYFRHRLWDIQNPVVCSPKCTQTNHRTLFIHGLCCIDYAKFCIDRKLFDIAGIANGIFTEPEEYRNWLNFALHRLEELQNGKDAVRKWTKATKIMDDANLFHGYMFKSEGYPNFSLNSVRNMCLKYGFEPDFDVAANIFHETEEELRRYWASEED